MTSDCVLLPPGNESVREKAIKQLAAMVEADVKSETAVECLNLMFENGSAETKDNAFAQLFEHHAAHPQTMEIIQGLGRSVSAKSENWIKQAVECSNEKVKINAVISLSRFYSQKQLEAQYYESAPPIHLQGLGKERGAYLKTTIDPTELTRLEEMLAAYVETDRGDGDGDLLEAAQKQLFALQNLAVGKHAPEIVSEDLDGVEFKLSDYRGQIVFVDFWGDW